MDAIEKTDVCKIMLLQEFNMVSKYVNKQLKDVAFSEIIDEAKQDEDDQVTVDVNEEVFSIELQSGENTSEGIL